MALFLFLESLWAHLNLHPSQFQKASNIASNSSTFNFTIITITTIALGIKVILILEQCWLGLCLFGPRHPLFKKDGSLETSFFRLLNC